MTVSSLPSLARARSATAGGSAGHAGPLGRFLAWAAQTASKVGVAARPPIDKPFPFFGE